jgi:hypothetical protein
MGKFEPDQEPEILSELQLTNIYMSLSEEIDIDFDIQEIKQKIYKIFEIIYTKDFLLKDTDDIQRDQHLINNSFVSLIKETNKIKYTNYGMIFLIFCDYFSLDENKTYLMMHEKIRLIIEKSSEKLIGKKIYKKIKDKVNAEHPHAGIKIVSIFDL